METKLKVTKISLEDMLNHVEQEYNPRVWKETVTRYSKYDKCQFYFIAPGNGYSYIRFFVSYIADGIYFFSNFSGYSGGITNAGFCKVTISESGEVYKFMFRGSNGQEGYAENCQSTRDYIRKALTPIGTMVSNCI